MQLQNAADDGMSEGGMIHIGIPDHIHKIKLRDVFPFHIFF